MYRRALLMVYISGEENRNIISKAENALYRYKIILGKKLRLRTEESREVETISGCKILNRFLEHVHCESMLVA